MSFALYFMRTARTILLFCAINKPNSVENFTDHASRNRPNVLAMQKNSNFGELFLLKRKKNETQRQDHKGPQKFDLEQL